mmetsp:Transcript_34074/g.62671  ORF Transcript_34074/g.62671 Transcript_34074/m.62671 type:complete len:102 (-) Transcript_34074:276-581(-)
MKEVWKPQELQLGLLESKGKPLQLRALDPKKKLHRDSIQAQEYLRLRKKGRQSLTLSLVKATKSRRIEKEGDESLTRTPVKALTHPPVVVLILLLNLIADN